MKIQLLSPEDKGEWNMEFVLLDLAVEEIAMGRPVVVYLNREGEIGTPEIGLYFEDGLFIRHGLGHQAIQDLFWNFRYRRLSSVEWAALFGRADEILRREEVCA